MKKKLFFGLAIYSGTSYFFLKNPEFLHVKKDKLKLPPSKYSRYILAHRGGSLEQPENTLQAFKYCVQIYYDLILLI